MTYTATITDAGVSVQRTFEADSMDEAIAMMEAELTSAEEITEGNPDCEPRTEWAVSMIASSCAECSLRTPDQADSASWLKCVIDGPLHLESRDGHWMDATGNEWTMIGDDQWQSSHGDVRHDATMDYSESL